METTGASQGAGDPPDSQLPSGMATGNTGCGGCSLGFGEKSPSKRHRARPVSEKEVSDSKTR